MRLFELALIWSVGIRDVVLTHAMALACGSEFEMNPLANVIIGEIGPQLLYLWKAAALGLFTAVVYKIEGQDRLRAQRLAWFGLATSILLNFWWDSTIFSIWQTIKS